jgi:hypothetical protein
MNMSEKIPGPLGLLDQWRQWGTQRKLESAGGEELKSVTGRRERGTV